MWLGKNLPIAIAEQYRRGAYDRYAINSMEDIELHDAARVNTITDKGGRCNASQSDVTRMATLSQTRVNSNYVLNFHNDAYDMEADIHGFHYFCVFLVYKIKASAITEHLERNYLISNWTGEKKAKYGGICFLPDRKTFRIHRARGVGSDDTIDFRAWRKTNPCEENRFHAICVKYIKKPKSSYSSLWVNGSYVTNFDSTVSSGSDQRITLGNGRRCTISPNYCCNGNLYHRRGSWSYKGRDNESAMSCLQGGY